MRHERLNLLVGLLLDGLPQTATTHSVCTMSWHKNSAQRRGTRQLSPCPNAIGVSHWSLKTLLEKLIKIGAKVITHARYVIFQMAEVAVPRWLFRNIVERIRRLRPHEAAPG